MRPSLIPDPDQDPRFGEVLRFVGDSLDATLRAERISLPPGVGEHVARAAFEDMRAHPPKPGTFYDLSGTALLTLVKEVEKELPGGHTNPDFARVLGPRLRDLLSQARP